MPDLSRRQFLRASSLTVLGAALAACSNEASPGPSPSAPGDSPESLDAVIAGRSQSLTYISVGTELLSKTPERLAFGILDESAGGLVPDATGRIWFAEAREDTPKGPFEIRFHGDGLPENRGFYDAEVEFPADGQWLVVAEVDRGNGLEIAAGNVQVGRRGTMPIAGDRAPRIETPTRANRRGVDPICTRIIDGDREPCGMHDRSLADVLAAGDKAFVIIATPAYCTSALCGPEVDIIEDLRRDAKGIAFVHIELLANDDPDTVQRTSPLAPAAIAFNTSEEPAVYSIDRKGRIIERILGPGDVDTFRSAIRRLQRA